MLGTPNAERRMVGPDDEDVRADRFRADVLQVLLDQLSEGILIVAADGTIVEGGRAAVALLGGTRTDEFRGRFDVYAAGFEVRDAFGRLLSPDEWPVARALRGERIERFETTTTDQRTGETRLQEIDAAPVFDESGRVSFAISLGRDVARQRRERDELERLYAAEHVAKQAAEHANDLLNRLNELALDLGRVLTPTAVADAGARLARRAADAVAVGIVRLLPDGATLETIASDGMAPEVLEPWRRFSMDAPAPLAECVRLDEPIFVSSPTERRTRFLGIAEATPAATGRSWACFPLHQTGLIAGAIGFSFDEVRTFPAADAAFLSAIAEQVSAALERAMLLEDSERARREAEQAFRRLRRLEFVTDAAISDLPFDELLDELLERVRTALEADSSTLLLAEGDELHVRATRGLPRDVVEPPLHIGEGVAGRIFVSAQPMVVEDLADVDLRRGWLREHMRSLAGVPLRIRRDLVGVLHVATVEHRSFGEEDVQLLELVGARVASALERAALYGEC